MTKPPIHIPPEWSPQCAIYIGWPSDPDVWGAPFEGAVHEVAALVRAICEANAGLGYSVHVLAGNAMAVERANTLCGPAARIQEFPIGDTWLRDTGAIFGMRDGALIARSFSFNGWGEKYIYEHDDTVAWRMANLESAPVETFDFILEGGALDWDGAGTVLTTEDCLLNHNRNTGWTKKDAENALRDSLGFEKVIWVKEGLRNDHTDGHIDNLARFLAPGVVACQKPDAGDPNEDRLNAIIAELKATKDADGNPYKVVELPSPGFVDNGEGEAAPASHMNFIIANRAVIVPAYNDRAEEAVRILKDHFPEHSVLALPAINILTGGGAFHCITQQVPQRP